MTFVWRMQSSGRSEQSSGPYSKYTQNSRFIGAPVKPEIMKSGGYPENSYHTRPLDCRLTHRQIGAYIAAKLHVISQRERAKETSQRSAL